MSNDVLLNFVGYNLPNKKKQIRVRAIYKFYLAR